MDNVTQEMKKDLYEFFCNSSFILYTVLEQMHECYILFLKYCIRFVKLTKLTCVLCLFWSCTFLGICSTARMQECMEKCFLQYFAKAFFVLANRYMYDNYTNSQVRNTSNWSIVAVSTLKLLLIIKSIRGMFKILQTLSCTFHSIFLPKFSTFVLFTLILNMPAITCILQTPCCHAVMTKIPLHRSPLRVSLDTCTIL